MPKEGGKYHTESTFKRLNTNFAHKSKKQSNTPHEMIIWENWQSEKLLNGHRDKAEEYVVDQKSHKNMAPTRQQENMVPDRCKLHKKGRTWRDLSTIKHHRDKGARKSLKEKRVLSTFN